mmetsp:Transcript_12295/g.28772  ORF Transcript_12295/g.28772 Transcript_12295/m.28772 type:complete len:487 (+) Transcript_12295:95-1555(+)
MLSIELQDLALSPRSEREVDREAFDRVIERLRALLTLSVSNKGPVLKWATKRRKADILLQRWKAMFVKHDKAGQGFLDLQDIKRLIRHDLKLVERIISDEHLNLLFQTIDADSGGHINFQEFFNFVSQPRRRQYEAEEDAIREVARGVRLAMHRHKMSLSDLEFQFHKVHDVPGSDDAPAGSLDVFEWRRFYRSIIKVTPHEVSDRILGYAFNAIDLDGSGRICKEEFLEFLRNSCKKESTRPKLDKVPGLMAGMKEVALKDRRSPRSRPKSGNVGSLMDPGLPAPQYPFGISGRDWPATSRMAVGSTALSLSSSASMSRVSSGASPHARHSSSLPRLDGTGSCVASPRPKSPGLGATMLPFQAMAAANESTQPPATAPSSLLASQGLGGTMLSTLGGSLGESRNLRSAPGGQLALPSPTGSSTRGSGFSSPSSSASLGQMKMTKIPSRYSTIKGGSRLNDIEERLYEAGIDLRGTYHRKDHLSRG